MPLGMKYQWAKKLKNNNNNNNNNPICKAPECHKDFRGASGQEQSCELNRIKSPTKNTQPTLRQNVPAS